MQGYNKIRNIKFIFCLISTESAGSRYWWLIYYKCCQ